jgi:hypothetical protein
LFSTSQAGGFDVNQARSLTGLAVTVRFGSEADILQCNRNVRFASDFDRKSRHRFIGRIVRWSATEEFDHARASDPDAIRTDRCPLEQGQVNWSQAATQAKARLGNSQLAPK